MEDFDVVPETEELSETGTRPERPVDTPQPPPRATTRTTRRPAKGRESTGGRAAPRGTRRRAPSAPSEPSPAETVRGLLQIPATAVVMVGQRVESVPLVADGATILVHGPAFAQAVEEIAKHDPRVAAILEKLVTFGPYGMFVTVCVIAGAQFARNHDEKNAAILEGFGAVPPHEIITQAGIDVPVQVSSNGQRDGTPPTD